MPKSSFLLFNIPAYVKLVFVMLFCLITLCNCGSSGTTNDWKDVSSTSPKDEPTTPVIPPSGVDFNDTELGRQIRQDYLEYHTDIHGDSPWNTIEDVLIEVYYGTYNGSIPVTMDVKGVGYAGNMRPIVVADINFLFNGPNEIIVWQEGKFYELHEAYDFGWLTQEDLRELADLHTLIFYSEN